MAHFALVMPAWVGHMNPFTTLGQELQKHGHRISALSVPDACTRIAKAGLEHVVIGGTSFPPGEGERWRQGVSLRVGFSAARYAIEWLTLWNGVLMDELPTILRRGKFDGVIMDQACYGAECGVDGTSLPLAVACNALPLHLQPDIPVHTEAWAWRTGRLSILRNVIAQRILVFVARKMVRRIREKPRLPNERRWNIFHHLNEIPPSLAQVAQLPACLDFPRQHAPDHFHYTGPWHNPNRDADAGESHVPGKQPLIYASLGTLQNGLDHIFRTILDACAELPVQLVLA